MVLNYSYGILINDAGLRFTDEAPGMVDATYEEVARLIMKQRHGIAFAVFDAKLEDVENWPVTVRSRACRRSRPKAFVNWPAQWVSMSGTSWPLWRLIMVPVPDRMGSTRYKQMACRRPA